jgi:hypothetical protein
MDDPKALALFQGVLKKTQTRQLVWEPTPQADTFAASMMGRYRLTLTPYTSHDNWGVPEGAPRLILEDENGNLIVEMSTGVDGISAKELDTLLVHARRIALNADQKIDEILSELEKEN